MFGTKCANAMHPVLGLWDKELVLPNGGIIDFLMSSMIIVPWRLRSLSLSWLMVGRSNLHRFLFIFSGGTHSRAEWSTLANMIAYCPNRIAYQNGLVSNSHLIVGDIVILLLVQPVRPLTFSTSKTWIADHVYLYPSSKHWSFSCHVLPLRY